MNEQKEFSEELDLDSMDFSVPEAGAEVELPKARIAYVMAIVAVLCGGNGIGIVAAGLYWKQTQNLSGAVGIVALATGIALAVVALIVLVHKRNVKRKLEE